MLLGQALAIAVTIVAGSYIRYFLSDGVEQVTIVFSHAAALIILWKTEWRLDVKLSLVSGKEVEITSKMKNSKYFVTATSSLTVQAVQGKSNV